MVNGEILRGEVDLPPARWMSGPDALLETVGGDGVDVVVNALVGSAGLEPTLHTLKAGKRLALANKESLVAGGDLVVAAAEEGGGELIPVDSEHSAILQCLEGSDRGSVKRLVLTASGGPFRGWTREQLLSVHPSQALNHPTWSMGAKITVDSATLANKALELIEAHFLYRIDYDSIGVVVHPQSIVHSFVEFVDGSVLAQLGFPTMELPILYALSYPERVEDDSLQTFDPVRASPLVFEEVDGETFSLFSLGERAGREGGTSPAVYNAANEIGVEAFLGERIGFLEMGEVVSEALDRLGGTPVEGLEQVLEVDREARIVSGETVQLLERRGSNK
jgi:1-deoxy-D-xylulose-5-phosphate reductoisomerase